MEQAAIVPYRNKIGFDPTNGTGSVGALLKPSQARLLSQPYSRHPSTRSVVRGTLTVAWLSSRYPALLSSRVVSSGDSIVEAPRHRFVIVAALLASLPCSTFLPSTGRFTSTSLAVDWSYP